MNFLNVPTHKEKIKLSQIIFNENIYPRELQKHDPRLVQEYANNIEAIDKTTNIYVSSDYNLIDGRHRQLAFNTVYKDDYEIEVLVFETIDEAIQFCLSNYYNSSHGKQLSQEAKKSNAIKLYGKHGLVQDEIAKILCTRKENVSKWLSNILEQERKERDEKIINLYLACYSQREIGEKLNIDHKTVGNIIDIMGEKVPGNYIPQDFEPQLYDVWNFHKATNEVKHPGNIPPEIVENLLHYYTNPLDIVFDPFGGGGATIDVCKKWNRRYYVSDIAPIPARSHEMRQWDISKGIPISSKLTFLDPPYYKKKEKEYTQDSISNLDRLEYLEFFKKLAKGLYAKQKAQTYTAFLMSNYVDYENRQDSIWVDDYVDIFKTAGFIIDMQIQCPLSTQQYKGFQVNQKKAHKQLMIISRELIVWTKS